MWFSVAEVAFSCASAGFPVKLSKPAVPAEMALEHPDAPKPFGIRLSDEIMGMASAIQHVLKP